VIGARTIRRVERYLAVFVAFAMQLVAVAVIGDVLAAAPREADVPPPADVALLADVPPLSQASLLSGDVTARVAPFARGERLIEIAHIVELARETTPVPSAEALVGPTVDVALAPAAEVPPEGEPAPQRPPEPPPAPTARPEPPPAPTARPAPPPPAITTSLATLQAEQRMLALMNASRLQGGLVPLALDAGVSDAARRHSAVEAQYRYVYHDGPDGTAKSRYVPACGTGWYGENTGKVWSGGVDVLHREFMAEPWEPINHRTNIMDPNFRRAGIGAVQGPDAIYVTVAFCR